jgi:hypothetical protein
MSHHLCHRFRPARKDGDFIRVQDAWRERFRIGIGMPSFVATNPDLKGRHIEVFTGIVDRPTAVSTSASGTTAAHGEKNALGSALERNLAESADRVLPQRDHPR